MKTYIKAEDRPLSRFLDVCIREDDILEVSEVFLARLEAQLTGPFPPSSNVTFFKLELAAAFMMFRPTAVEPVKATFPIPMWLAIAAPTVLPYPEIKLTVPAGNPAPLMNSHIFSADNGVVSDDLMTIVLPVASAGAIFQLNISSGKLCIPLDLLAFRKILNAVLTSME